MVSGSCMRFVCGVQWDAGLLASCFEHQTTSIRACSSPFLGVVGVAALRTSLFIVVHPRSPAQVGRCGVPSQLVLDLGLFTKIHDRHNDKAIVADTKNPRRGEPGSSFAQTKLLDESELIKFTTTELNRKKPQFTRPDKALRTNNWVKYLLQCLLQCPRLH